MQTHTGPEIKMVNVHDPDQVESLMGHEGGVKSLAYDPLGKYLASASCTGQLVIHAVETGKTAHKSTAFSKTDTASASQMMRMSWHPNGTLLALPGKQDVQLMTRDTWVVDVLLKGGHSAPVSVTAWSPNGLYLVTAGEDKKLVVWDVAKREELGLVDLAAACTAISWSLASNSLIYYTDNGAVSKWQQPVPSHMPSPFGAVAAKTEAEVKAASKPVVKPEANGAKATQDVKAEEVKKETKKEAKKEAKEESLMADEAEEDEEKTTEDYSNNYGDEGSDHERGEHSEPEHSSDEEGGGKSRRKRLQKGRESASAFGGYEDFDEPLYAADEAPVRAGPPAFKFQEPFQSGSTSDEKRSFLVWNELGSIVSHNDDTYHLVFIEYSDSTKHRPVRLRDHYHFQMAALGEHGAIFASKESTVAGVKQPSTIFYQPMDSWAPSDWTLSLPYGEEATCVAVGSTWCAVSTTANNLRVYSYGGVQKALLSLEGEVVNLCAQNDRLAITYHRGNPIKGNQDLGLRVVDMINRVVLHEGPVPLSPKAKLTWTTYAENRMLLTMDSSGIVRGLSSYYGSLWTVLLDCNAAKQEQGSTRAVYWPVSVIEGKLMVAICKAGRTYPKTKPRPILTDVSLAVPFMLDQASATAKLEQQHATLSIMLQEDGRGLAPKQQVQLDKLVLSQIQAACKSDKIVKALDLSTSLLNLKSLNVAMTIANRSQKTALAERISMIQQAKQRAMQNQSISVTVPDKENIEEEDEEPNLSESPSKGDDNLKRVQGRKRLLKGKKEEVESSPKKVKPTNPFAAKEKKANPFRAV
jgi:chromosome transmission fidelity protein 4